MITFAWIMNFIMNIRDLPRLYRIHDFYKYLLDVPEQEIQSISWQEIVSRIMALRDSNPTITGKTHHVKFVKTQDKQRMDAHDIANRLMRKDNYMIAMINKDVLDLSLPVPVLRNRKLFSRTLEWNLQLCITDFVFNRKGHVRAQFLRDTSRKDLSRALRTRFVIFAATSLITAPFLATFFVLRHFFTNFNDYQKNPGQIGMREYTPYAQWKFREFNELEHLFKQRINMSLPFADRYINQFPKDKLIQVARFVSLVSGAIVSVLGLATVLDQENFLNFEITPGRTAIFYIGVFGSIWAVSRGMLPDDDMVYDTAFSIQEVIQFTHYEPAHWLNRLHTVDVKEEFSQLYQMKLMVFFEEVMSIFYTPFILAFSLTKCSDRIIDFFREFTVHVDGIGYVCTFAEFRFMGEAIRPAPRERTTEANGNIIEAAGAAAAANATAANQPANTTALRDEYFASKDNKMEQSYWGFMNDYSRNHHKTNIHFPYNSGSRRRFNFPPPVPGLPSPGLAPYSSHRRHNSGGGGPSTGSLASPPAFRQNIGGTPKFGAHQSQYATAQDFAADRPASPLQSLLLDPHHQPSASGFGTTSPQTIRPTRVHGNVPVKATRQAIAAPSIDRRGSNLNEDEEDIPPADLQGPAATEKKQSDNGRPSQTDLEPPAEEPGPLGSWKYEVDSVDDDGDEDDDQNALALLNLGPLGLIKRMKERNGMTGVAGV
jgi:autophagy-related protein 9